MTDTYLEKATAIIDAGGTTFNIIYLTQQLRASGEMLRLLKKVAPQFQSYEECDATYCKTSHDHPIRAEIDKAVEHAELAGITTP